MISRIAVLAESVSLAHVSRSELLASQLSTALSRKALVSDSAEKPLVYLGSDPEEQFPHAMAHGVIHIPFPCISSRVFLRRVWDGEFPYTVDELEGYITLERAFLESYMPELVIGDCRPTLAISCSLYGVPYVPLVNAYWDPDWAFQLPILPPLSKYNGIEYPRDHIENRKIFRQICEAAVQPFNELRLRYGLHPLRNYCELMTEGEARLYPDPVELFPGFPERVPNSDFFLGPLAPSVPMNQQLQKSEEQDLAIAPEANVAVPTYPKGLPKIFICLGSSSPPSLTEWFLENLPENEFELRVALGRKMEDEDIRKFSLRENCSIADFYPAHEACVWSDVTICNGGSPMSYIARSTQTPIIGIISNFDQALNMCQLEHNGMGISLSYKDLCPKRVCEKLYEILDSSICCSRTSEQESSIEAEESCSPFPDEQDFRVTKTLNAFIDFLSTKRPCGEEARGFPL